MEFKEVAVERMLEVFEDYFVARKNVCLWKDYMEEQGAVVKYLGIEYSVYKSDIEYLKKIIELTGLIDEFEVIKND